ncbi:conserved hypothetical protein [Desulfatibacillum aliphaticivorans]|uniref:Uncharacterized protein n=1 Tax=Desulfatibacillum aliphaticivorans TaxID=218208 RepID=B8FFG0_DESAL|nr:hypothetical protein [Desulfatibacillum aliphaticivorans]ACL04220.1 conserved hypothetical protein [Desulfatibacillum aliphaticivorans]
MEWLYQVYLFLDGFLIAPYRMAQPPILGFYLGTGLLALYAVVLGALTSEAAIWANARNLEDQSHAMVRMHNLSFRALAAKNKKAFKAANHEANDAFGKYFFAWMANAAASLWPLAFALGWMQWRFQDVHFAFPGLPIDLGFAFLFLICYILASILFSKIKKRLPIFAKSVALSQMARDHADEMVTLADLQASK